MCSQYWNLTADFVCPKGHMNVGANLQTHYMGEIGSCSNWYKLNEPIPELAGITVTLGVGRVDDLIGDCDTCEKYYDFGARIVNGRVLEVWVER